jgi:GT2 family glycosyltransferase
MTARPRCAVVIPTFNGAHLLGACLESLFAHPPKSCELAVVVVDDGSGDGTADRFADYDERVTLIAREANGGFAVTCNQGAEASADAEFLVFLNNDTVPLPGWLDALVEDADAHPDAGAVGARLLYPDGTVQHAGIAIGQDRWPHHLYAGLPGEHKAVTRSRPVVAATAAALLVRQSVFEQLGGFDTDFVNGYEDVDFCLRMGETGHTVRYCARSVLYHLESVTRWADDRSRHVEDNSRVFAERWRGKVEPDDFQHYLADGLIQAEYGAFFPVRLSISPLLATVQRETETEDRLEHLLTVRSEQVLELQSRRTLASVADLREKALATAPSPSPRRRSGGGRGVVNRGGFHRLREGTGRHRVSVLMPLRNAGQALRETLPLLLDQRAAAELELVGADSASVDDTVDLLKEFDATVIAVDPAEFDHGLTRNLLAEHARGDVLVFLNERSRPVDDRWLAPLLAALDSDPGVAGASSRVLPYPDADPLTRRDGLLEPSGSPDRWLKRIEDWGAYATMPVEERRLLINFPTVSAAIRAEVIKRFPFQSVRAIGEDLLWAREVLEAGMALVHEPDSQVFHSHDYSLREWLMRNVDDGIANREINGRSFDEAEAGALVRGMIAGDWSYLRDELELDDEELQRWQIHASLRRAAQVAGQWLGVNYPSFPPEVMDAFSRVADSRRGHS